MSKHNTPTPLRVVQWTTGNVGRQAVIALTGRDDLDLVGVYAHSPDKAGRDVGEIIGGEPLGVVASNDVDEVLALRPDCVLYMPLHIDVDEVCRILRSGANVVTSSEFMTGYGIGAEALEKLKAAAVQGGATLFGSGMNPGFAQLAAAVLSGICREVRRVRIIESFDLSPFADDPNMDDLPFGEPGDDPELLEKLRASTLVFGDGVEAMAELLDIALDDVRCTADFAVATQELDLPGGPIAEGHVAGIDLRWEGLVADRSVIELNQRWVMGRKITPEMPAAHAYLIEIEGDPQVNVRMDFLPDGPVDTLQQLQEIGMRITALPLINAVRHVVAAQPGLATYASLGVPVGRLSR